MRKEFELPVTAEYSEVSDAYIVIDPHDKVIAYNCNKETADYIVQAINSHEKLVKLLKDAQRYIRPLDPKFREIEQALKAEKK